MQIDELAWLKTKLFPELFARERDWMGKGLETMPCGGQMQSPHTFLLIKTALCRIQQIQMQQQQQTYRYNKQQQQKLKKMHKLNTEKSNSNKNAVSTHLPAHQNSVQFVKYIQCAQCLKCVQSVHCMRCVQCAQCLHRLNEH